MTGHHIGQQVWRSEEEHYGVQEYGGLGNIGLFQLLLGAREHDVCDAETEDIIGLLEKVAGGLILLVVVFAHAGELSALAGEYICVLHMAAKVVLIRQFDNSTI